MTNKNILVGDMVEVHLNTELDAFRGIVLELNNSKGFDGSTWYKVEPAEEGAMPGNFWYRENKVKKANKKT